MIDVFLTIAGTVPIIGAMTWARQRAKRRANEKAELIAMGAALGIEYVPGESTSDFRYDVIRERDRLAREERRGRHK